ncbi:MAG: ABC transporter permease [Candidatus Diapherotrites archaeon]|uniref:ABC transporter permease n=1 Tax=Candidatus Iainarchaeum sp. TaxID=3101447 RepID=A0A8T4LI98_9ARCH|nr:ABC transporter permease [Candidatus Diapherotrites archaeon]
MKFQDSVNLAVNSLLHRRLRSWLTLLGIIIGVAAVVAIISIGEGAQASVNQRLSGLGADIINVSPGFSRASRTFGEFRGGGIPGGGGVAASSSEPLTDRDVLALKAIPQVAFINEVVRGNATASFLAEESTVSVQGINPVTWRLINTTEVASGRYLTPADRDGVVVGWRIANEVFKKKLAVGNLLVLNKRSFRVVGILRESLNGSDDSMAFMVNETAQALLEGIAEDEFTGIQVKLVAGSDSAEAAKAVEQRLMVSRHVTERDKDFTVSSTEAIRQRVTDVTGTLVLFLLAIAAVSLVVGSIGIANSMFTSVLEKTKEIGILKALGSSNEEILRLFLIETALFGFVGGVIGAVLGSLIALSLPLLGVGLLPGPGSSGGITTVVNPLLVLAAIAFSTVVGVVAGAVPARQAASLHPVDALRYE